MVGDSIVVDPPVWLQAIMWGEIVLQLPFCIVGGIGWAREEEWVKLPGFAYGIHVLTTMLPIMATLWSDGASVLCLAVYGVWVAFPALMVWHTATSKPLFKPKAE